MRWLEPPCYSDIRGDLIPFEDPTFFEIKRVYFLYPTDGATRGGHRHLEARQLVYCVQGYFWLRIVLNGVESKYELRAKGPALLLEPEEWHELYDLAPNTVVAVFSSHLYDPKDYVMTPLAACEK